MSSNRIACPSCGASLPALATHCDLCGTTVHAPPNEELPEFEDGFEDETEPVVQRTAASHEPVVCSTCSHVNPAQSRFCNQCGTFLGEIRNESRPDSGTKPEEQEISVPEEDPEDPTGSRPPSLEGKRALMLVGVGLLVVVILYGITVMSGGPTPTSTPPNQAAAPGESQSVISSDSVEALVGSLEAENTAESWAELGRIYLSLAFGATNVEDRESFAQRSVDAFDVSLSLEENTDVRTALAEAAQFDPRNPMRAVQELQAVLQADPDHITANYLFGTLRMKIGRLEGAAESFRRVIDVADPSDPIAQQAARDLASVEDALARGE
ncbi:MAG: zinc ribbon domain-containing protein [Rubricoccaceae bacterium]|nr:zinc ribbon domain-containing protein [Rubricoccaceae bacterium]